MIDHAVCRPLDHAEGHQVFRGSVAPGYVSAAARLVDPGRDRGNPGVPGSPTGGRRAVRRRRYQSSALDLRVGGLEPWNLIEGRVESLSTPNAVAVDRTYFDRLGISGLGAQAEIRQQTCGSPPLPMASAFRFTTTPYVFMDVDWACALITGCALQQGDARLFPGAGREGFRCRTGPPRYAGHPDQTSRC